MNAFMHYEYERIVIISLHVNYFEMKYVLWLLENCVNAGIITDIIIVNDYQFYDNCQLLSIIYHQKIYMIDLANQFVMMVS